MIQSKDSALTAVCFECMGHLNSAIRREMIYVVKHKPFLELLSISHPTQRQAHLNFLSAEQVCCLCNRLENIPYQEDKLRPFKRELAELADRNSSFKRKKKYSLSVVVVSLEWCLIHFSKHLPN